MRTNANQMHQVAGMINEKQKYLRLLNFVRKYCKIKLYRNNLRNMNYCTGHFSPDAGYIFLTRPRWFPINYSKMSSYLVHEFGHCIIGSEKEHNEMSRKETLKEEVDAWNLGKINVPQELIPKNISKYRYDALRSYKRK